MKKKIPVLRSAFRSLLFVLNLLAIFWLLLCKGVSLYNPAAKPTFFSLISFTTTFVFFLNLFFIFYWLFTRKKIRSLYSLVTIILLWSFVQPLFGFNFFSRNDLKVEDSNLKLMTWNVHLFDLGAWTKDETAKAKIINLIQKESPDILCMEEYYRDTKDENMPYTDIVRGLGYPYVAFAKEFMGMKRTITIHAPKGATIEIGNVIFSKFPISNFHIYNLGVPSYNMLSANIMVDSTHQITVNVVHLTSVEFGEKDMEYITEVKEKGIDGQNAQSSKSLLRKLKLASSYRAALANKIDSLKKLEEHPMIICGDFNDIPSSYVYEKIKGNLADPFTAKGIGFDRTYRHIFPTLRIDQIFYDKKYFKVIGYGRRQVNLSDHYPVIANFMFRK